jgi:hypothetical protein
MSQLSSQSVTLYVVLMGFVRFLVQTAIISLNAINRLIFVMVKCGVLFEVRTEHLIVKLHKGVLQIKLHTHIPIHTFL